MKDREENGTVYSVRERLRGELTFLSLFFFASLFFFFFPFFFRNFANFAEAAATLAALSESESMSSPFELYSFFKNHYISNWKYSKMAKAKVVSLFSKWHIN